MTRAKQHETRTMDELIEEAVAYLRKYGPCPCSHIGQHLWPIITSGSSNPFTRPAGKVLHAAMRKGLVRQIHDRYGTKWAATDQGAHPC